MAIIGNIPYFQTNIILILSFWSCSTYTNPRNPKHGSAEAGWLPRDASSPTSATVWQGLLGPSCPGNSTLKSCKSSGDPSKIPQRYLKISGFSMNFIYFDVDKKKWDCRFGAGSCLTLLVRYCLMMVCCVETETFQAQIPSVSHWNARACSHEPLELSLGTKKGEHVTQFVKTTKAAEIFLCVVSFRRNSL